MAPDNLIPRFEIIIGNYMVTLAKNKKNENLKFMLWGEYSHNNQTLNSVFFIYEITEKYFLGCSI